MIEQLVTRKYLNEKLGYKHTTGVCNKLKTLGMTKKINKKGRPAGTTVYFYEEKEIKKILKNSYLWKNGRNFYFDCKNNLTHFLSIILNSGFSQANYLDIKEIKELFGCGKWAVLNWTNGIDGADNPNSVYYQNKLPFSLEENFDKNLRRRPPKKIIKVGDLIIFFENVIKRADFLLEQSIPIYLRD